MHAYFGQLKARCACFTSKIQLKKTFITAHCFDWPQVCSFGNSNNNSVFISERVDSDSDFLQISVNCCISLQHL